MVAAGVWVPPPVSTLARTVVPATKSRTNTSMVKVPSPTTSLVAKVWKATYRPSALMEGA